MQEAGAPVGEVQEAAKETAQSSSGEWVVNWSQCFLTKAEAEVAQGRKKQRAGTGLVPLATP